MNSDSFIDLLNDQWKGMLKMSDNEHSQPLTEYSMQLIRDIAMRKTITVRMGGEIKLTQYELNVLDVYMNEIDWNPTGLGYEPAPVFKGRKVIVSDAPEMTLTKDQAIKRINDIHDSKSCDHLKTGVSLDSHLMTHGAIEELKAIFDISDKETLGGEFDKFEHVVRFVKSIEKFKEPKHKSVVWIDIALAPKDRAIVVYDPKPSKEYGPDVHAAIWSEDHGRFIATENVDTDPLDINPESFTYDIIAPHSQTPSD